MTAEEARARQKHLRYFDKFYMVWICGVLNATIARASRKGDNYIERKFCFKSKETVRKEITKIYQTLGYTIGMSTDWEHKWFIKVRW